MADPVLRKAFQQFYRTHESIQDRTPYTLLEFFVKAGHSCAAQTDDFCSVFQNCGPGFLFDALFNAFFFQVFQC